MSHFNARAMDPARYIDYYKNQAGGVLPGYVGGHAMYGAGIGGIFRNLFRMAVPFFKTGFSIAKPHLKAAAKNIVGDIVNRSMLNNQDGSGAFVMARNIVKRPPGKRRSKTSTKPKRKTKKRVVCKGPGKVKQSKRAFFRKNINTIF